jgi:hypothetical protein
MLIFRKAAAGELKADSGLGMLAKQCEINVEEVGVGGAKDFFEAKVCIFLIAKSYLWVLRNFLFYLAMIFYSLKEYSRIFSMRCFVKPKLL